MFNFFGKTANKFLDKVSNRSKSSNQKDTNEISLSDFYFHKRKLPDNFAEKLLNLEIEIEEGKYTINNINSLMELYSIAVEYYESIVSNKHFIFQNKLRVLMSNPKVIETINEDYVRKNKNKEQHPFVLSQKQKADNFHQEFLKNSAKNDQSLNKILEVHNNKMASLEGLIVGQISNQQDNIMKRLEERKIKNNRPKSQPPTAKNTEENGSHTPVFSKKKEELPQFHKNKDESPKIQKKIKEKIYKEEKKLNIEESSPENINITQMLNIIKSEEIRKSNKFEQKTTNLTKNNYDLPFKMSKKDVEDKKFDNQIKKYDDIILKKTTKKESNDKITEISKNLTKKNEDIKILRKEEKNDKIAFKILDIVFPVLKTNISTTPTSQEKKTMTLTPNVVPKVQKSPKEEAFEKNQKTTFRIIKKSEK